MPYHYNAIHSMMEYHRKEGITKNKHLITAGYYERQVIYNFLSMSRQRNPKRMIDWAIISARANYGSGSGDMVSRRLTYLCASAITRSIDTSRSRHLMGRGIVK